MKKCTNCLKLKPLKDFYIDRSHKDGKRSWCKKCHSVQAKKYNTKPEIKKRTSARMKKYHSRIDIKHMKKNYSLRVRYGLTVEEVSYILETQNNRCGICEDGLSMKDVRVDHDHETGRVRGLLCNRCNLQLGWCEKNRDAVNIYLEQ